MLHSVQVVDYEGPICYSPRVKPLPLPEPLPPPANPTEPIRNSKYYLDSITFQVCTILGSTVAMVSGCSFFPYIQVENELFKVPIRCVSFKTEPFRTLAARSLPQGDGPVEGMSDENPIVLPDTSKVDFERLLDVICVL